MFFGLKVRSAMLYSPVILKFGPQTANALGRAISHAGKDWRELIARLKSQGLSPREAGAVAAAWMALHAKPDRLGFDLAAAMKYSSESLSEELISDPKLFKRFCVVNNVMIRESLIEEAEPDVS